MRYLARRGGIAGLTPQDEVKCDMLAEAVKDGLSTVNQAPFRYCQEFMGCLTLTLTDVCMRLRVSAYVCERLGKTYSPP